MLQACAIFATFFKCRSKTFFVLPKTVEEFKNCFEFVCYKLKKCVQPENKTKRKNVSAKKLQPKTKTAIFFLLKF